MDLLKDAAKNISLYDVKAYVRKAQNVAMNLTEMESKVREATNNEPWGSPSTLMAQIAAGTYNYREREEIIGFVFRRFTEKAANEWRQIYKALQLLDYLLKNGSERLIDDVRANLSLIQMLKSFHYIDSKGRDQGINVRNKAKNLIAFLNDDALIRSERKKARANAKKFGGVSSAAFGGASSITTGGYDDEGDFTNRVYGDGGVYGERFDDPAAAYKNGQTGNENYEEYDVAAASSSSSSKPTTASSKVTASATKKPSAPEPDLLGDLDFGGSSQPSGGNGHSTAQFDDDDDDDDFDDFQAAPSLPQSQQPVQHQQQQQFSNANFFQSQPAQNPILAYQNAIPQQQQSQSRVPSYGSGAPNYNVNSSITTGPAAPQPKNDAFSSLFSSAKTKTKTTPTNTYTPAKPTAAAPIDDDFFGGFSANNNNNNNNNGGSKSTNTNQQGNSSNNGEVDLLSF
ncbi:epsin N-terminal homology-containing protein [Scheffersomyces coipomensis]|uniref:epsin N-terminal homology-containing protein n=1 Tax=Scheffersomyces coipomensis TaxID=1788519 RepID=UPI00315D14FA